MSRNAAQPDLFAGQPVQPAYVPNPEYVRNRLEKVIGEMRAADVFPWERTQVALFREIIPRMAQHLPEEEGARWRAEFEAEMARLENAA
jgi:hypothetical protein